MESDISLTSLSNFEQLELLGVGTFGHVHKVRNTITQKEYAMKVLRKNHIVQMKQLEHLRNEKNILLLANHPYIIKLYQVYMDNRNVYLLMELSSGEFFTLLRTVGRLDKETTQFYAAEMVLVIEYLHSKNIIYRDLKPENVLLDINGHIKLCDFGFAKEVVDQTWTLCGTPEYLAPEVIMGKGHDKAVDWWSLGVLIYEMYAGYPPFYGSHAFDIYEKICDGQFSFPGHFYEEIKDIISKLLSSSKTRRLGNLREGASDVKSHPFFFGIEWGLLEKQKLTPPIHVSTILPSMPKERCKDANWDLFDPNEDSNEDPHAAHFKDFLGEKK